MKCDKKDLILYAVTDRTWVGKMTLCEQVEEALKGGATFVQLREKELDEETFIREAFEIKNLCKKYNVPFVINDNVDIAIKVNADGVHIGQKDMEAGYARTVIGENKILGVSAQTVEQAILAEKMGADYLGVGAVFSTGSKEDADDVSLETLKAICEAVSIPVVAIGGIGASNILQLTGSGISGVAVISAIFAADNIQKATAELKRMTNKVVCHSHNKKSDIRTALTIAGSDSCGGAGIQADIKTMTMNGVYAMSAVTALTAQNTTGVRAIEEVTPEFLKQQIDAVFEDIFPDSVKIGMVSSKELINVIADRLEFYNAKNIVVDPVMVATSGSSLIKTDAIKILISKLLPIATLITPNIPEAEILSDMKICNEEDMAKSAKYIGEKYRCNVLLKGGHNINNANDLLYENGKFVWFNGKRIDNPNTHGTGCTLSSAIASNLAKGYTLEISIQRAKDYISGALSATFDLGKGSGPLNHAFKLGDNI